MREISVHKITEVVERLCIDANTHLPGDVKCAIESCRACEDGSIAKGVLDKIIENYNGELFDWDKIRAIKQEYRDRSSKQQYAI